MPRIIMASRLIFVTDTNIWIDLYCGKILKPVFQLPLRFVAPDVIVMELEEPKGNDLLKLGLVKKEMPGSLVVQVAALAQKYRKPSINDLFALVLAKELTIELLTGDKNLRKAAAAEGVKVRGTLWLLDEMVRIQIISPYQAATALLEMLKKGRRLPKKECEKRIKAWSS